MGCNYKIATIAVAILTVILAGSNLYKLSRQDDEDIRRYICYRPKHDARKDMLHRRRHDQVRSHTTVEDEESFEDKVKHGREKSEMKDEYLMKITKESDCRLGITDKQMKGFRLLGTIGIGFSILSLISSFLVSLATTGDMERNHRYRGTLLPYIFVHLAVIGFEIFAEVYSVHLIQRVVVLPLILLSVSVVMLGCYITVVLCYFKSLKRDVAFKTNAKEVFDYSIMPEEKDASEA